MAGTGYAIVQGASKRTGGRDSEVGWRNGCCNGIRAQSILPLKSVLESCCYSIPTYLKGERKRRHF